MRPLALILLLALPAAGGTFVAKTPSCKPVAPIDLDARLVGDPASPTISVKASSRTGGDVEIEIVLPEGVTHVAGERKQKGRRCEARVDARVPDRLRREILVRATTVHGGATLTKVVPLVLFDRPAARSGNPKKNSRGEAILVFSP
jgi:hypothetical protein